ncbi:unnamed protein product [Soboliphyme baturini]|uniref:Secreted protein n=1 Tax=Soboliphyme baturini TaxID=241478 RepID=A0A183IKG3_9BILA|nr:unnamed protein product [Soboliphyme baturini]
MFGTASVALVRCACCHSLLIKKCPTKSGHEIAIAIKMGGAYDRVALNWQRRKRLASAAQPITLQFAGKQRLMLNAECEVLTGAGRNSLLQRVSTRTRSSSVTVTEDDVKPGGRRCTSHGCHCSKK